MRSVLILLVLAASVGCDSAALTPSVVTVASDKTRYGPGDAALFTVHNGSQDTLYVGLCGTAIEKATGTEWSYHTGFMCGFSSPDGEDPLTLPGGTSVVRVEDYFLRDFGNGRFRLRLSIRTLRGQIADSVRTSNAFDIVYPGGDSDGE